MVGCARLCVFDAGFFEGADEGEIAVAAFVIEAVAYDEFITYFEADVICGDVFGAGAALAEEDADFDAGGVAFLEEAFFDGGEGASGVEDVVEKEDVAAFDFGELIAVENDGAAGFGAAVVGGDGDGIEVKGELDAAHEIGCEDDPAVEDGDDGELFAFFFVVGGDLGG